MPKAGDRKSKTKRRQRRKEAVPTFPVTKVQEVMERAFPEGVVKPEAALYLTVLLEYLAFEMIEHSLNAAMSRAYRERSRGNRAVTDADLSAAIAKDPEMKQLMEQFGYSEPTAMPRFGRF